MGGEEYRLLYQHRVIGRVRLTFEWLEHLRRGALRLAATPDPSTIAFSNPPQLIEPEPVHVVTLAGIWDGPRLFAVALVDGDPRWLNSIPEVRIMGRDY